MSNAVGGGVIIINEIVEHNIFPLSMFESFLLFLFIFIFACFVFIIFNKIDFEKEVSKN